MIQTLKSCDFCKQQFDGVVWRSGNASHFDEVFCSHECVKKAQDED